MNNSLDWTEFLAKAGVTFSDVAEDEWYYNDVMLAANGKK
jgi:hypothetical protein